MSTFTFWVLMAEPKFIKFDFDHQEVAYVSKPWEATLFDSAGRAMRVQDEYLLWQAKVARLSMFLVQDRWHM